jgi:hypothetical protein
MQCSSCGGFCEGNCERLSASAAYKNYMREEQRKDQEFERQKELQYQRTCSELAGLNT